GLDHVLDPVGDHQIPIRIDRADVLRVEVAAVPQRRRRRVVLVIAAREPRRANHDLARGDAVVGDVAHLGVDDAEGDERCRGAGGEGVRGGRLGPERRLRGGGRRGAGAGGGGRGGRATPPTGRGGRTRRCGGGAPPGTTLGAAPPRR